VGNHCPLSCLSRRCEGDGPARHQLGTMDGNWVTASQEGCQCQRIPAGTVDGAPVASSSNPRCRHNAMMLPPATSLPRPRTAGRKLPTSTVPLP
jgi:hypothetical protein